MRGATAFALAPEALSELERQEEFESVVLPMSLRVTIVELKESMYRWPLGDPATSEFRYCGSPAASGPTAPTMVARLPAGPGPAPRSRSLGGLPALS
jgi:GcrA cell cycle regulator